VVISLEERIYIGLASSKAEDDDNEKWGDKEGMPLAIQSIRLRITQF
jgi:hypothetical protein